VPLPRWNAARIIPTPSDRKPLEKEIKINGFK
jgi:hypothetical protein